MQSLSAHQHKNNALQLLPQRNLAISHDKKLSEKKQKEIDKPKQNSMTNVHFLENHVYKYVSGDRKPIAIRIDSGLYSRFKPLAKRVYGSVCHAVEVYITALISAVETGVYFSTTEKPINIENIVIERNLRPRRKLSGGFGVRATEDQLDYLPTAVKNGGSLVPLIR